MSKGMGKKQSRGRQRASKGALRLPKDYPWVVATRLLDECAVHMLDSDVHRLRSIFRARDVNAYMELAADWCLSTASMEAWSESLSVDFIKLRLLFGGLLKKYPFTGNSQGRVDAAIGNLLDGDKVCSSFNRGDYQRLFSADGKPSKELTLMREFCSRVLGPFNLDSVVNTCRHGPGSTTSSVKGNISRYHKYLEWPYHVTPLAVSHAKRLILSDERWLSALEESYWERWKSCDDHVFLSDVFWNDVFTTVSGNEITTVPKDYHKDRTIAIEPTLNLMLQLGVDGHIRRRLKRWRIDLDTQYFNAEAARLGTVSNHPDRPATIDLSNASDSISLRIVKLLLPEEWYDYVCAIRSPKGTLPDGRSLRYSKLSSMGNGATFAIESLVFASVCYAASVSYYGKWQRGAIFIIGDDIVVPETIAPRVVQLLEQCGFSTNQEKTFLKGPIKESCGADWLNGRNVRPVFLKKCPENVLELYSHRNLIFRWCVQHLHLESLGSLDNLYQKWIPPSLYCEGPLSDEEFSGYFHTVSPGRYFGWSYRFKSVEWRPYPQKGPEFAFRKLMADLRPGRHVTAEEWLYHSAAGHTFNVTSRGRGYVRVNKERCTPEWRTSYCSPDANHVVKRHMVPSWSTDQNR